MGPCGGGRILEWEKLFVEAEVELDRNITKLVVAQKEVTNLQVKLDRILESKANFIIVRCNSKDELVLINVRIEDLKDQIVTKCVKVEDLEDLEVDKIETEHNLRHATEKLIATKEKSKVLEGITIKHKVEYEMASQWFNVAESGIHLIQNQLQRMEKDGGSPCILSLLWIILRLL